MDTRNDVLRIPTEAVMEDDQVYRYNPDGGTLELVTIKVGIRNWNFTEVTEGIEEGDQIVLSLDQPGLAEDASVVPKDD
jgi:HlyD family secretion protein